MSSESGPRRRRAVPASALAAVILASAITACSGPAGQNSGTGGSSASGTGGSSSSNTPFGVVEAVVNPFYAPFPQALKDAAADFDITPVPERNAPQDYDQSQENAVVDAFVAKGMVGISIQPVDPVGGNATIKRLVKQGIFVVGTGACDQTDKAGAVVCIQASLYDHAYVATNKLIDAMGGSGKIVHLAGALAGNTTPPRIKGVEDAVAKHPGVTLIQTITDIDTPQLAQSAVASLLAAKKGEINGVISTAYNPSVAWANAMTKSNEKGIPSVMTDTDPLVFQAVKDGYVTGTTASNAYAQAYLAAASLKLLSAGCKFSDPSKFLYQIPYKFVDAAGVATITEDLKKQAHDIAKTWKHDFWQCA